jgi:hypothetical protein
VRIGAAMQVVDRHIFCRLFKPGNPDREEQPSISDKEKWDDELAAVREKFPGQNIQCVVEDDEGNCIEARQIPIVQVEEWFDTSAREYHPDARATAAQRRMAESPEGTMILLDRENRLLRMDNEALLSRVEALEAKMQKEPEKEPVKKKTTKKVSPKKEGGTD